MPNDNLRITILNSGKQNDYLYGLVSGLTKIDNIVVNVIDNNKSAYIFDEYTNAKHYKFVPSPSSKRTIIKKITDTVIYYKKLLCYIYKREYDIVHIQWEFKLKIIDRIILPIILKKYNKKLVITVHNVNADWRDEKHSIINYLLLYAYYKLANSLIVHTELMKEQLITRFNICKDKVLVIEHGIMNRYQKGTVNKKEARKFLNISSRKVVLLFFGGIDYYKGVLFMIKACSDIMLKDSRIYLIIAGQPKNCPSLIEEIKEKINSCEQLKQSTRLSFEYIKPEEVEYYFNASDCLILPYKSIFQSGVLFLGYNYGIPILASDVGNFKNDIIEGVTGYTYKENDPHDFRNKLYKVINSDMLNRQESTKENIKKITHQKYSWDKIALKTAEVYKNYNITN